MMSNNSKFCGFGKYIDTCPYLSVGYNGNTCPLAHPTGMYRAIPFTNNYWQQYAQPKYVNYIDNNNARYFMNDIQLALPIFAYASQALANIENIRKDAEEMRLLLQSQRETQIAIVNSYAQRNRNIIPNRSFGFHLTNEQLKLIWQFGSELLSDHIKESIKKTDIYKSSDEFAQKAQLFAVDVGKEVVDKTVEDLIDSNYI